MGNHKTVKQAPLKTKRRREQGFDVHQSWINGNETSRNIHSMTGNFSRTYQVFISYINVEMNSSCKFRGRSFVLVKVFKFCFNN